MTAGLCLPFWKFGHDPFQFCPTSSRCCVTPPCDVVQQAKAPVVLGMDARARRRDEVRAWRLMTLVDTADHLVVGAFSKYLEIAGSHLPFSPHEMAKSIQDIGMPRPGGGGGSRTMVAPTV